MARSTPIGTGTASSDAPSVGGSHTARWSTDPGRHDLVCSTPDERDRAWAARNALVRTAIALLAATRHDPDIARCASAGCALAPLDAAERCDLVHRLAALDVDGGGAATGHGVAPDDPARALEAFDQALVAGLDAVRTCRQTVHPVGHCWFTALPGGDGCRDVLAAGHRIR